MSDNKFPLALPAGTVLAGQYVIEKPLGQGGFGITYAANDHKTGQKVAVKEFFPDTLAFREATTVRSYPGERSENFEYGKESFLQEAKTLAEFIGCEGVVRILSYFEENGTAYFVMEYIDGISFDAYIKQQGGKISIDDAKRILIPIMDALAAVHAKGIIHRDVTPDNIYITNDGAVKLLDFGAARYSLGDKSRSLDVILKHGFAPKEQYTRHGKQGPFTDIYSLGATFYFALTGRRPPDSIDRMEDDNLIPPSTLGAQLTEYQEKAILQALEVQPNARFVSMATFKQVLLNETGSATAPKPAVQQVFFTAPASTPVPVQAPVYTAPEPAPASVQAPVYIAPEPASAPATEMPAVPAAAAAASAGTTMVRAKKKKLPKPVIIIIIVAVIVLAVTIPLLINAYTENLHYTLYNIPSPQYLPSYCGLPMPNTKPSGGSTELIGNSFENSRRGGIVYPISDGTTCYIYNDQTALYFKNDIISTMSNEKISSICYDEDGGYIYFVQGNAFYEYNIKKDSIRRMTELDEFIKKRYSDSEFKKWVTDYSYTEERIAPTATLYLTKDYFFINVTGSAKVKDSDYPQHYDFIYRVQRSDPAKIEDVHYNFEDYAFLDGVYYTYDSQGAKTRAVSMADFSKRVYKGDIEGYCNPRVYTTDGKYLYVYYDGVNNANGGLYRINKDLEPNSMMKLETDDLYCGSLEIDALRNFIIADDHAVFTARMKDSNGLYIKDTEGENQRFLFHAMLDKFGNFSNIIVLYDANISSNYDAVDKCWLGKFDKNSNIYRLNYINRADNNTYFHEIDSSGNFLANN